MKEEIFGPILPIFTFSHIDNTIELIKEIYSTPLAVYVFSTNPYIVDRIERDTISGALVANDLIVHMPIPTLPFGGVRTSGFGSYSGYASWNCFSHSKSVLRRRQNFEKLNAIRYPPYEKSKRWILETLLSRLPEFTFLPKLGWMATGAVLYYVTQNLLNDNWELVKSTFEDLLNKAT